VHPDSFLVWKVSLVASVFSIVAMNRYLIKQTGGHTFCIRFTVSISKEFSVASFFKDSSLEIFLRDFVLLPRDSEKNVKK